MRNIDKAVGGPVSCIKRSFTTSIGDKGGGNGMAEGVSPVLDMEIEQSEKGNRKIKKNPFKIHAKM